MNGGLFGAVNLYGYSHGLPCDGTSNGNADTGDMISFDRSYALPAIVDLHIGPCVVTEQGCDPFTTETQASNESSVLLSGLQRFALSFCEATQYPIAGREVSQALCNALVMLGEVPVFNVRPAQDQLCAGVFAVPTGIVQGFNSPNLPANAPRLVGRRLPDNSPGVVIRPWVNGVEWQKVPGLSYCYSFPASLTPVFVPAAH